MREREREIWAEMENMIKSLYIIYGTPKHNKYVVNQKLEHVDDISFRKPLGCCFTK
jgi:hypothetical protein